MQSERTKLKMGQGSIIRYWLVGAWNTAFSLMLFNSLLVHFKNQFYEILLMINFAITSLQSYLTQRLFVWKSKNNRERELLLFLTSVGMQYGCNALLLFLASHIFSFNIKFMGMSILVLVNTLFYFVNKNMVFRKRDESV